MPGRAPCIIGVAQRTFHPGAGPAPEPLCLWEEVGRAAAEDSGAPVARVLDATDSLDVLYCQSWPYDDPAGRLAARLGVEPARRAYSGIGGTTPHLLLAGAAGAVARGDLEVAMVVGGEALETVRQAKKAGERLAWSHRDPERKPFPFEAPFHPAEVAHGVFQAWLTFALFDVARRAHLGTDPARYRRSLGEMLAPMTAVAEANPHAWFRQRRTPGELMDPSPSNRMVGYPYTKNTVAIMDVDMAAALVVASHDAANALGVPPDRRVYLHGAGYAEDPTYPAQHQPMWSSPAMRLAAGSALAGAGLGGRSEPGGTGGEGSGRPVDIDDVAHLDLYSCFASSLNFASDALSLRPGDTRPLTVTGGLPFAGGPGSGYVLHSTAAMVDVLRGDPGSYGLVSGVGMHMTKHAFAVYCARPPGREGVDRLAGSAPTGAPTGAPTPESAVRPITDTHTGPAVVAAYSVVHDRAGEMEWGLAVCDLEDGSRTYARMEDPGLLAEAEDTEWVGAAVHLEAGPDQINRVRS